MTDANVLVAGSAFPRWPYEVLRHAARRDFALCLCPYVVEEARRTLRRAFPGHERRLERFLKVCPHRLVKDPSPTLVDKNLGLVRSAKDVPVVLAARVARVEFLVTSDRDLTVEDSTTEPLRRWFTPILPAVFLREVMGWTSAALEAIRHRTWEALD